MALERHARARGTWPLLLCVAAFAAGASAERPAVDLARGRQLYATRCAVCHGADGDGRGPVAASLDPPPRDLTRALFRVRSTRPGDPPSDDDLFQTLTRGLAGTAMPAWSGLSVADRWALVDAIKSFSTRFEGPPPVALAVPTPPELTQAALERGRKSFRRFGCVDCHGELGRGDGLDAPKLVDTSGRPLRPYDMSTGRPKRGNAPVDLFLAVRSGIEGTPMPGYAEAMSEEDTWELVAFVRSLSEGPALVARAAAPAAVERTNAEPTTAPSEAEPTAEPTTEEPSAADYTEAAQGEPAND
ncbi:MAG: c-type cytochrome [Deltaproteobacteria bacterium]|nr:c-type cytochrome [Deltaproteobacteria bacterium]